MLTYTLYGLFILSCVILILVILLQPGKSDAGALFSSSVSSTAFGPRGTQTLLAKITIGAAAAFMLIALALSLPFISGTRSVLQSGAPAPAPFSSPTPVPQASMLILPSPAPASSASVNKASPQPSK